MTAYTNLPAPALQKPAKAFNALTITANNGSGNSLPGALVRLDDYYSEPTNNKGEAAFSSLTTNSYEVSAGYKGMNTVQRSVSLGTNQNEKTDVKLSKVFPRG